jgi:hypothetical protein
LETRLSTSPTGVPPIVVASQTLVENLYVTRAQFADQSNAYVTVGNATQSNTAFGMTVSQISDSNVYYLLSGNGEHSNVSVFTTANITFNAGTDTLAVGNLTSNGYNVLTANSAVASANSGSDITFTGTIGTLAGQLNVINANVGIFGAANAIPVLTVNDKGLVVAVSTANINSELGLQGTDGSNSVIVTGDTITFSSNNNVVVSISNANIDISTAQNISNTASPAFANLSIANSATVSGNLSGGNLTVLGITTLDGNISVGQNANIAGNLTVNDVMAGNIFTGNISGTSLLITGGTALEGNLQVGSSIVVGNALTIEGNLVANQNANIAGNLVVNQNANIAGNLTAGNINLTGVLNLDNLNISGNATIGENLATGGNATIGENLIVSSNANSTSTATGAIITEGGLGVLGNIYVGENIFSYGTFTSLGAAVVGQSMTVTGALTVYGGLTQLMVEGASTLYGNVVVNSNSNSTSPFTGALQVVGGVGVQGNLNVNGISSFAGNVNIESNLNVNANVSVVGLTIDSGALDINSNAISVNTTTGALVVAGGVGIGGNLNVNDNVVIVGNLTVVGNTTTNNSIVATTENLNIALANNATTTAQINNGGILLGEGNIATFLYQFSNGGWNSNVPMYAPNLFSNGNAVVNVATLFTSASSQDVIVSGTYNSLDTTLATVNSSPGTFGAANSIPVLTVNGKGLVTNVTVSNIIPGINLGLVNNNVTSNSSLVFNASLGSEFKVTLNGNVTSSTFINGNIGPALICFRFLQGPAGNYSFTWPTNVRNGQTVNPTANSTSIQLFAVDSDGSLDGLGSMQYVFNAP